MAAGNKIEKVELFKAPSVRILTNFLSDEECAHLIQEASDKLSRSSVLDKDGQRRIPAYSKNRIIQSVLVMHPNHAILDAFAFTWRARLF